MSSCKKCHCVAIPDSKPPVCPECLYPDPLVAPDPFFDSKPIAVPKDPSELRFLVSRR